MQKHPIADTDILVSPLGLGTVKFGRNQGIKYPQGFELPSDQEVLDLLALSKDLGINLLDTAPAYGLSEERLGKLLTNRQDWVIETKVGESFENGESHFDFTAAGTRKSIERSLQRLQTDYLDMVLIHSDGNDTRILQEEEVLGALHELKREGLTKAIGISSKTAEGGLLAFTEGCDVVMATHNPIYTDERPVLQAAAEKKRSVLIKKAFASGHLNKLGSDNPVQHALEFIFQEPGVTSIILGTINPQHLKQNVDITNAILTP
jgi:aryl-alcohol dehydrogenase-like predicted oxidoreductase